MSTPAQNPTPEPESYKLVKIPKKRKGEFREICIPNSTLKYRLRVRNFELNKESLKFGPEVIGFVPGRGVTTGAIRHVGYNFTLSFDLKDFFDTVTPSMVDSQWSDCFINNRAYQGLPTSPAIANLAFLSTDKLILNYIQDYIKTVCFCGENEKIVYTRYADDLTFSFNYYETYLQLRKNIPLIVESNGFFINSRKTHLQTAKFGRRMITGVAVDKERIYIPREIKRKMRTAKYYQQFRRYYGLSEWAKLKMPNSDPLVLNAINFNDLSEYNRITNMMTKGKKTTFNISGGTVIFTEEISKPPTNYNFIGPIQNCETKDLSSKKKKLVGKGSIKNRPLTTSDIKKAWKRRSKQVFKEIASSANQQKVFDIIKNSTFNKIHKNSENDLIKVQNSGNLAENQSLAENY
jgi:hypothetical protein